MTRKSLFWGCAFITLGLSLLLYKFDLIQTELKVFLNFWPVFFILAGLALLKINEIARKAVAGVAGVLLGLIVAGAMFSGWHIVRFNVFDHFDDASEYSILFDGDTAHIDLDSNVKSVDLKLNTSAGSFFVSDSGISLADIVADAQQTRAFRRYDVSGDVANLRLSIDNKSMVFHENDGGFPPSRVRLNSAPIWNIVAKTGAADFQADLSRLRVESFSLKGGATSVNVRFGDIMDRTDVKIKTGASSVRLSVPKSVGCTIKAKIGLSDLTADQFEKIGNSLYRSSNYDSTSKRIDIEIKGGVSHFMIDRY